MDKSSKQVRQVMKGNPCLICMLAKWNKPSIGVHKAKDDDLKVGEVISGDIVGKINPSTREGDEYFFLFADMRSGSLKAYVSRTKKSLPAALKDTINYFENHGHKVKYFRSDSEQIMK